MGNKITGRARSKLKSKIRSIKHQEKKYGITELEKLKLQDLENELKRKCKPTDVEK